MASAASRITSPARAEVRSAWSGDQLGLQIMAMGQEVNARLDVRESLVQLEMLLPPALAFFARPIELALRRGGEAMLEDKSKEQDPSALSAGLPRRDAPLASAPHHRGERMRHVAIIGSGPAGYYSAEALQKALGDEVRVDIIDRMPVPYGLIRFGVAPDHQSIKAVYRRYEKVALSDTCPLRRQCPGRPRRLDPRIARPLRRGDPRDRRAARPAARHSGRRSARRDRLGRLRRLV